MTHLLTGSEDGYIRDYDIFTAVNGKVFLTAPQRHHAGVVEGTMKAGQIRSWWENPGRTPAPSADTGRSPVHSLALHSDALWGLSGTDVRNFVHPHPFICDSPCLQSGKINLFTVRHEPGRLFHVMQEHNHGSPVSALSLQHDERGFFSAGWDGQAIVGYTFTGGSLWLQVVSCASNGTSTQAKYRVASFLTLHSWPRSQSVPWAPITRIYLPSLARSRLTMDDRASRLTLPPETKP